MAIYRLFILDAQENLINGVDLGSSSDDEALEWSSFVLPPERIGELWRGARRVGRIEQARVILHGKAA